MSSGDTNEPPTSEESGAKTEEKNADAESSAGNEGDGATEDDHEDPLVIDEAEEKSDGGDSDEKVKNHFLAFGRIQVLETILRLLNLQLQRQRCSRLERFSK
jgi:hypothetical protein